VKRNQGQCRYRAVPGGTTCYLHGGNKTLQSQRLASLNAYRLSKFQAEIQRHAEDDGIKSLRTEIGILRVIMEERLNACKDSTDLLLQSGPISDLVSKIERVVTSCHKLENQMGQLLDKQALMNFANTVISIVTSHVSDENTINAIANGIIAAMAQKDDE
jgi:hypothetical protein